MSSINGVGSGARPMVFDDPMMEAQALAIDDAREERRTAKTERAMAQGERDAHFDQSIKEERAAAVARLASGLVSAGTKLLQGATTLGTTLASHEASEAKGQGEHLRAERGARAPVDPRDRPAVEQRAREDQASTAREHHSSTLAARNERVAGELRAAGEIGSAAGGAVTAGLDYVADAHRIAGKQAEREADRAKERADDAGERARSAGEVGDRMLGRMEEIARAQRQAEDQRIANIRG
ncbi:MAG: hypothetical protein JNK05_01720 [Myxococcales bacterium]|nr:hypothetical protein [Myxococcales bacterium]